MSMSEYVWIYGLAEALAVTLIVTVILGVKWWRLRREHQAWDDARARIDALLAEEIDRARSKSSSRPELRDSQVASLKALSKPFRSGGIRDEGAWTEALGMLDRCFEGLRQTTASLVASAERAPAKAASAPLTQQSNNDEDLASLTMDSDIDALLTQNSQGRSAFASHRESGIDLKQRYQELLHVNQNLRARIDTLAHNDPLRQELDTFAQSNLAFMQAAFAAERNFNLLDQQFDDFEERIHNLQVTVGNYRKSVHKLISERDLLNEEKQQYLTQLDLKDKVIARLNRNYDTLRREYTKIYGNDL